MVRKREQRKNNRFMRALRKRPVSTSSWSSKFAGSPLPREPVVQNRDGYAERVNEGPPRVDVGASFFEAVHDRPVRGGSASSSSPAE